MNEKLTLEVEKTEEEIRKTIRTKDLVIKGLEAKIAGMMPKPPPPVQAVAKVEFKQSSPRSQSQTIQK